MIASIFYIIYIPLNLAFKNFDYTNIFVLILEIAFDIF